MLHSKISIALASAALLIANPLQAMPDTVEELRTIIETEYAGRANAYAEAERSDFRRMGCKGRDDLLQAMLDDGLILAELSYRTHSAAALCALNSDQMAVIKLLVTPDYITSHELANAGQSSTATLLWNRIYADDYEKVRHLLEHGVHTYNYHRYWDELTREEHLLLAANSALDHSKEDAIRAFRDAGFGHILDAARNNDNVQYVRNRLRKERDGSGGGGLFRAIAGGLAGAYLGGTTGAAIGALEGGSNSGKDNDGASNATPQASGPLPLATNRVELGVLVTPVITPQRGFSVVQVLPNSSAGAAGILPDDIIISIAGEPVASRGSLYVATEKASKTPEYEVAFLRSGQITTVVFGPPPPPSPESVPGVDNSQSAASDAAESTSTSNRLEELERLADLRDRGILTDEEFEAMKAEILD